MCFPISSAARESGGAGLSGATGGTWGTCNAVNATQTRRPWGTFSTALTARTCSTLGRKMPCHFALPPRRSLAENKAMNERRGRVQRQTCMMPYHGADRTRLSRRTGGSLVSRRSLFTLGAVETREATVSLHTREAWHSGEATRPRGANSAWGTCSSILTVLSLKNIITPLVVLRSEAREIEAIRTFSSLEKRLTSFPGIPGRPRGPGGPVDPEGPGSPGSPRIPWKP